MTVAALILAASPDRSLFEVAGQAAVRRLADVAWSGGALPVVVVAADPDGAVAAALAGAPVTLVEPAPAELGPVGRIARAIDVAASEVEGADAVLLWPAFFVHVDPETVTSLIEAHGAAPAAIIAPAYRGERGWPVLVPVALRARLDVLGPSLTPGEIVDALVEGGAPIRLVELGDPGATHDRATAVEALPPFEGPPQPVGVPPPDWGERVPAADPSPPPPRRGAR